MNRAQFMQLCRLGKGSVTPATYRDSLLEQEYFTNMVDIIIGRTKAWSKRAGLLEERNIPKADPGKEEKWKAFFRNNSFDSTNQMRLFAEAISIIEGVEALTFLKIAKKSSSLERFDSFICIVPTECPNSHSYKIGEPILNIERGDTFYKMTGGMGNSMTLDTDCYRIATDDEVVTCLWTMMYRNSDVARYIINELVCEDEDE